MFYFCSIDSKKSQAGNRVVSGVWLPPKVKTTLKPLRTKRETWMLRIRIF